MKSAEVVAAHRSAGRPFAAAGLTGFVREAGQGEAVREDGGRAFLQIMRGFERTPAKRDLYRSVLGSGRYPVQVVWGAQDPALKLDPYGEAARRAAGAATIHQLPAKHFLQEDQAPAIAELVAAITRG